jgi:hypothetical protein
VAHAYNTTTWEVGGGENRILSSRPAWGKLGGSYLRNKTEKQNWGHVLKARPFA